MKKLLVVIGFFLFAGIFNKAFSQEKNFVISTEKPHQVEVIIETANEIAEKFKNELGEIQVVLYGPAVKELGNPKTVETWLEKIENDKIHFAVCNIAIEKTETTKEFIPKEIEKVENAFTHILKLKAKGYIGIEP